MPTSVKLIFQPKNAAQLKEAFEKSGRNASIDAVNECLHVEIALISASE
ncbi:hypothetical protein ACVWZR_006871 [Bradyrhizobium sp. i1.3.1]